MKYEPAKVVNKVIDQVLIYNSSNDKVSCGQCVFEKVSWLRPGRTDSQRAPTEIIYTDQHFLV